MNEYRTYEIAEIIYAKLNDCLPAEWDFFLKKFNIQNIQDPIETHLSTYKDVSSIMSKQKHIDRIDQQNIMKIALLDLKTLEVLRFELDRYMWLNKEDFRNRIIKKMNLDEKQIKEYDEMFKNDHKYNQKTQKLSNIQEIAKKGGIERHKTTNIIKNEIIKKMFLFIQEDGIKKGKKFNISEITKKIRTQLSDWSKDKLMQIYQFKDKTILEKAIKYCKEKAGGEIDNWCYKINRKEL